MKPTIYLGLGGTGNLAISNAKRLYEEEYGKGNIPSSVAFVTVDFQTNMDEDPGLATDIKENFIKFESQANPRETYRIRRENDGEYTWMFEGNTSNIDIRIDRGAKGVRTTGRLYTEMVLETIISRFSSIMNSVTNVDNNADVAGGVNIHMVMSLAGGSGAGSCITLANAIRQRYGNQVNLYGYGVMHSIFRVIDPTSNKIPNAELNAISSIIDLDYLMTADEANVIPLEMGTEKVLLKEPIFDGFYVIDNTSESGHTIRDIKNLCNVIGTCLYACGAEAGDKVENVINNIGPKEGKHHVGAKLGWVQGLGACQVVYKGELLAKTYGYKAALELIRKIRQESASIEGQALAWTEIVSIREDGDEYNMLIDDIFSPQRIQTLRLPNIDAADTEAANKDSVNRYLNTIPDFPSDDIISNRKNDLLNKLRFKINSYLNAENGVGNSLKFLSSLYLLCDKYKNEMNEEALNYTKDKEEKLEKFERSAFKDYNDQKHGRFVWNHREKNQELLEDNVGRPAKEILKSIIELKRREVARDIFNTLLNEIDLLKERVSVLDAKLENLSEEYVRKLTQLQSTSTDSLVFEYDLSYSDRINMEIDSNDIVVNDFVDKLSTLLIDIDVDTKLNETILAYVRNLPQAQGYKEKIISDIIDELSDDEYKKLKNEIQKKSARWLRVNSRGQRVNVGNRKMVEDAIAKNWVVSIYKSKEGYKSRLEKDVSFLPNVESKDFLYVTKEAAKQRMIFCRIDGSIIPYCIGVIDDMSMRTYEDQLKMANSGEKVFNPHFDKHLFERMRQEDFKLKPEMKNEAMFYWVCGHLFGWEAIKEEERIMNKDEKGNVISEASKELAEHMKYICCLRKKYMYWDINAPMGKDRQWQLLGNTTRRDSAFNTFKTVVLPEHKENYKSLISNAYGQKRAYWDAEIQRIISSGFEDYIDRLVCSDKSSATHFANPTNGDFKLLQEEFQYLKNSLISALGNLK